MPDTPTTQAPASTNVEAYRAVRATTEALCRDLSPEDCVVQTAEQVSPAKWHLAHTSWFFERFLLAELVPGYEPVCAMYDYLFNSYYNGAGPQHCRPRRGLISRPTLDEVHTYRRIIDERMAQLIDDCPGEHRATLDERLVLGLNHEQQHQELIVTDIKHVFSSNPLLPAYCAAPPVTPGRTPTQGWVELAGGVHEIGHAGAGFAYDNESPRHRVYLEPFALATRPVTNGEYLAFIDDGGYERHELWLSLGWATVQGQAWRMPIYWYRDGRRWMHYTLAGPCQIDEAEPVAHLSHFEADACARWAGARLPSEAEWEVACRAQPVQGNLLAAGRFHPAPLRADEGGAALHRCFGDVWEWTRSSYGPYPGYRAAAGTLGEYNGKFMCNQYVLRGGSCATPAGHVRSTYRNFFEPEARWQFAGLRLARDAQGRA